MAAIGYRVYAAAAANTFADFRVSPTLRLVCPFRIRKLTATDRDEVASPLLEQLFSYTRLLDVVD